MISDHERDQVQMEFNGIAGNEPVFLTNVLLPPKQSLDGYRLRLSGESISQIGNRFTEERAIDIKNQPSR